MKSLIIFLKIVIIFGLLELKTVESLDNPARLEVDKKLYFIETKGDYTWKNASSACKKLHSNLIEPKGDYDYAKLKDAIKHNYKEYSSFWTTAQVKSAGLFHYIGLGKEEYNRKKCFKFQNSTTFKFLPENCGTHLGFICERPLLHGQSIYKTRNTMYFIEPQQESSCVQAIEQCEKRQMVLLNFYDLANHKQLSEYLYYNYASSINFWFGSKNESHNNCETVMKNSNVKSDLKLGFICQKNYEVKHGLTVRHIILIIFIAVAAFIAIIVFLLIKFVFVKTKASFDVPVAEFNKEMHVTDIK